jgi:hypothetical protein
MKGGLKKLLTTGTLLTSLFFLNPSYAKADDWTKKDIYAEIVWEALHLIDWEQTRTMVGEQGYTDSNFFLKNASTSKIDNYMGLWCILHPTITNYLPKKANAFGIEWGPRALWQATTISISGGSIANNYIYKQISPKENKKITLGFKFKF